MPATAEKSSHTPISGPWFVGYLESVEKSRRTVYEGDSFRNRQVAVCATPEQAHLIAAAPDHALICWAMCVAAGRWEPWGDGRGEFCINGLRYATNLDAFGCPVVTDAIRAAIAKAEARP